MEPSRILYLIEKYDISFPDTDMEDLERRLRGNYPHESHCNCSRLVDIGSPGCSCKIRKNIKILEQEDANFLLSEAILGKSESR